MPFYHKIIVKAFLAITRSFLDLPSSLVLVSKNPKKATSSPTGGHPTEKSLIVKTPLDEQILFPHEDTQRSQQSILNF